MSTLVGVLTEPPLPGVCKPKLLAAYGPDWVAGLSAAILRDMLDGAQGITADDYVVLTTPTPSSQEALEVLVRHVPVPWKVVAQSGDDRATRIVHGFATLAERSNGADATLLLFTADAPSFDVGPLSEALAEPLPDRALLIAPAENGDIWALAASRFDPAVLRDLPWGTPALVETLRVRCRELGIAVREITPWYTVEEPSDVLRLLDELRKHPDRAPRSAQYLVTHG